MPAEVEAASCRFGLASANSVWVPAAAAEQDHRPTNMIEIQKVTMESRKAMVGRAAAVRITLDGIHSPPLFRCNCPSPAVGSWLVYTSRYCADSIS